MATCPRLVLTPGEPAGIGPDLTVQLMQSVWPAEIIVIADPELLLARAKQLNLPLTLRLANLNEPARPNQVSELSYLPTRLKTIAQPGVLNVKNAEYVLTCLDKAVELCLTNRAQGLVTGPIQKSIIAERGVPFDGHTNYLKQRCQSLDPAIMFFVVDDLRVALLTTHIPLQEVAQSITSQGLIQFMQVLHRDLQQKFGLSTPRYLLCGINPHAGERGLLGQEEITILTPAIKQLRHEGLEISDAMPADTIFTHYQKDRDVIIGMYHDQVLPVIKYAGFDRAVNITLGLPIIRTSVDHGTALELAGTGTANVGSLRAAVALALRLSPNYRQSQP